jgi:3-hydroxybutyryl-CoA dehydrogenase
LKKMILIAGSGKMARNIGLFFMRHGHEVTWTSRHVAECTPEFSASLRRDLRRLARSFPGINAEVPQLRSARDSDIPSPHILVESTEESLAAKREMLGQLDHVISEDTLVLSNSSSLLPSQIHPRCLGVHFFYPVELSSIAELIVHSNVRESEIQTVSRLLDQAGIATIKQTEHNAFAVNRLLLPIQAECFRALMEGHLPQDVDQASKSYLLPVGQLSLIDSVGMDIIHASVCNYQARMTPDQAGAFAPLAQGLEVLRSAGKLGKKNRNGLLVGATPPWEMLRSGDVELLSNKLLYLFINSCYHFLRTAQVTAPELNMILQSGFHAECSLEDAVARENGSRMANALAKWHTDTALAYYQPEPAITE